MKALIYTEPGSVVHSDVSRPEPGPREALLRVSAAGVCGSDVNGYLGRSKRRIPPLILGHELSGVVAASGHNGPEVGTRVAVFPLAGCRLPECAECAAGHPNRCQRRTLMGMDRPGGFAEYVVAAADACFPLPDSVSDVEGALVEPLANAIHLFDAILKAQGIVRRVAIVGGGGQGLMALLVGRLLGFECLVVEPNAHRRQWAVRLGAHAVLDPTDLDPSSGLGEEGASFEAVIETAGFAQSRRLATELAAPGAVVLYLGLHDASSEADDLSIINRELTVIGSYAYTARDFQRAIELIATKSVDVTAFATTVPLAEGVSLLRSLASEPGELVKAVFVMAEGA